jgi:large subunit ribosomal protein L32
MAHPKRKISKTRRDKRRTHYKATPKQVSTCQTTGEVHLRHTGYVVEGNLFYNGKMIVENYEKVSA